MAEKTDAPQLHEFRVRTRRTYTTTVDVDGTPQRVTYRGGAKLFLTMDEGSANRDALRLVKKDDK